MGGVNVVAIRSDGAQFSTHTWDAGGYSLALPAVPAGTYTVWGGGGTLGGWVRYDDVTIAAENVKRDFRPDYVNSQSGPDTNLDGDADGDGDVDVTDLGILASNWQQSPRTFAQGDFDNNGIVDVNDLGILATHWQQTPASPTAPFADFGRDAADITHLADDVLP
jgi:hypothetical protein